MGSLILIYSKDFFWPGLLALISFAWCIVGVRDKFKKYHPFAEIKDILSINKQYWPSKSVHRSILLKLFHVLFFITRISSPLQYFKIFFKAQRKSHSNPNGDVAAWFVEAYIILWIAYEIYVLNKVHSSNELTLRIFKYIFLFQIIQVISSCLYYNFFRMAFLGVKKVHYIYRNILLIMFNYIETIILYSFFYLKFSYFFNCPKKLQTVTDCIYFSIVTITTLGYGDIYPNDMWGKVIISTETAIGILMLVLALGRMIGFTEKPESHAA